MSLLGFKIYNTQPIVLGLASYYDLSENTADFGVESYISLSSQIPYLELLPLQHKPWQWQPLLQLLLCIFSLLPPPRNSVSLPAEEDSASLKVTN